MKTIKRILSLMLSFCMLAALAACGAEPSPTPQDGLLPHDPLPTEEPGVPEAPKEEIKPIAAPVYPKERSTDVPEKTGLDAFAGKSIPVLFSDLDGENRVYSPLNVYMALAMLAEVCGGETRAQILDCLGCTDIEALRAEVKALFEASYADEELLTVLPAASFWLRDDYEYKAAALQHLADDYYAAAFRGTMGDPAYTQALRDWINENTNHLLQEQADGLSLDADIMLALVTTLYFKGRWADAFSPERTEKDVFHADSGDRDADFMHRSDSMLYVRGERFGAVRLGMYGGAGMWIVLPDEGTPLQELIDSGALGAFLSDPDSAENKNAMVHLTLPRFDVDSDLDLVGILCELGVTDVFDRSGADFSPLTDDPLYVDTVEHAARVKIDEEGCEAAAFTAIMVKAAGMPIFEEEVDFVCDRPFFFAVTGSQGQLLFTGAVNEPAK